MPVLKASKKGMRQSAKRYTRLYPIRTKTRTFMKKMMELVKEKKVDEAKAFLPQVYKAIDMAAKKKIFQKNNAARKKSLMARQLAQLEQKMVEQKTPVAK